MTVVDDEPEDVPEHLAVKPKVSYKIYSVLDDDMVLTVSNDNKLIVSKWDNQASQKFHIHHEHGKYAFVNEGLNAGLCVFQDKKDNAVQLITDGGKHESSFFEITRAIKGKWTNKAYVFRTHAPNKVLDLAGGKAVEGKGVLQYNYHGGENQLWLFEALEKEKKVKAYKGKDVAPVFKHNPNFYYKVLPLLNKKVALSITKDNKVQVEKFNRGPDQKYVIHQEGNKFAFVNAASDQGIHVDKDRHDNAVQIMASEGKCASNWFEIVRADKGEYAGKGYLIKTHTANMTLDLAGGKNVLQYNIHQGGNQLWAIEPAGKIKVKGKVKEPVFDWKESFSHVPSIIPFRGNQGNNMNFMPVAHFKPGQNYIFYPVHSNNLKSIDIVQNQQHFGLAILYSFHGGPNQRFVFEQEGPTHYRIKSVATGKYLALQNDDSWDGIWAQVVDRGNRRSELWSIYPATEAKYAGKGAYHLYNGFNKCLEIPGGCLDNSTHIQQGSFCTDEGQTWIIKEI